VKPFAHLMVLVALVGMLLVGCGGSTEKTDTPPIAEQDRDALVRQATSAANALDSAASGLAQQNAAMRGQVNSMQEDLFRMGARIETLQAEVTKLREATGQVQTRAEAAKTAAAQAPEGGSGWFGILLIIIIVLIILALLYFLLKPKPFDDEEDDDFSSFDDDDFGFDDEDENGDEAKDDAPEADEEGKKD
jgi:outer membrane murein-binding lipoprotein Lpp